MGIIGNPTSPAPRLLSWRRFQREQTYETTNLDSYFHDCGGGHIYSSGVGTSPVPGDNMSSDWIACNSEWVTRCVSGNKASRTLCENLLRMNTASRALWQERVDSPRTLPSRSVIEPSRWTADGCGRYGNGRSLSLHSSNQVAPGSEIHGVISSCGLLCPGKSACEIDECHFKRFISKRCAGPFPCHGRN